jgi:gluconolactonase
VGDIVVTSIDRGHLYRVSDAKSELFAVTGGGPNGATEGIDGSIYVAQNGGRGRTFRKPTMTGGIQAVRPDGRVVWVTTDPVAPNDLCFGPDGLLYLTDPTRRPARDDGRLWRVDVANGDSELLASTDWFPNGIGFGLEDDAIYVASTGDNTIRRLVVGPAGVGKAEIVISMKSDHVHPDGFAFDDAGNIVIASFGTADGTAGNVQTWSLDGKLLDLLELGTSRFYTNVAITKDHKLLVTDSDLGAVLVVEDWPHAGMPLHPFRQIASRLPHK